MQNMGLLFVIVMCGATAGMISLFGYSLWVVIVLGVLWLAAVVISLIHGHTGFGGRGNTDLNIVIAGLFITAIILIPKYKAHYEEVFINEVTNHLMKLTAPDRYTGQAKLFTDYFEIVTITLKNRTVKDNECSANFNVVVKLKKQFLISKDFSLVMFAYYVGTGDAMVGDIRSTDVNLVFDKTENGWSINESKSFLKQSLFRSLCRVVPIPA